MLDYNPHYHFWQVAGHDGVYSSAAAKYVSKDSDAYQEWITNGGVATAIASHDELVGVLRCAGVAPFHRVASYTIVTRLQESGLFDAAMAALENDPAAKWRFATADSRGGVDADAPDNRAFLTAIGADPDEILAPD